MIRSRDGVEPMAIRLKLRLRRGEGQVEVVALVSSAYETSEPEIIIPSSTAEELGLLPELPPGSAIKECAGRWRHREASEDS